MSSNGGMNPDRVQAALHGDADVLTEILDVARDAVWPLCVHGVGGRLADAEDVLSETLYRALRSRTAYDPERPLGGWLRGITVRVLADHHRRRGPVTTSDAEPPEPTAATPFPSERVQDQERRTSVAEAMDGLDQVSRTLIQLRYAEGLSRTELATVTGLEVEAVKKRLQRARAWLRTRLHSLQQET